MSGLKAQEWVGRLLGDYRLVCEIGRGADGVVFLAEDERSRTRVAVKVYTDLQQGRVARLAAERLHGFRHPACAHPLAAGEAYKHIYVARTFVAADGPHADRDTNGKALFTQTLDEWMHRRAAPPDEDVVLGMVSHILDALECAHALQEHGEPGLLYGGVHPRTILIQEDKRYVQPVLTDLGVPTAAARCREGDPYVSPEERDGQVATQLSDIYALGAITHLLLTGEPPGNGAGTRLKSRWRALVARACNSDPGRRYSDYHALRTALLNIRSRRNHRPILSKVKTGFLMNAIIGAIVLSGAIAIVVFHQLGKSGNEICVNPSSGAEIQPVTGAAAMPPAPDTAGAGRNLPAAPTPTSQSVVLPIAPAPTGGTLIVLEEEEAAEPAPVGTLLPSPRVPAQPEELLDVISGVVMEGKAEEAPSAQTPAQGAEPVEQPPAAQVQPGEQPAATPAAVATFATYTIQKGDTLFSIARAHGMNVTELQTVNALTTIVIRAGDTLKVRGTDSPAPTMPAPQTESGTETPAVQPAAPTPAPAPAELTPQPAQPATARYLVQRGDTYYSISRALGCPVGELMALNSTQDLKYGTYIVVPASATNKVPPATQPQ